MNTTEFVDLPMYKETNNAGDLITHSQNEALLQSIKMWLVSGKGEKIRSNTGGVITPYLGKIMDVDTAIKMSRAINLGLQTEFDPPLTVLFCNVTPVFDQLAWKIDLVVYSDEYNLGVDTSILVNN